MIDSTVNNADKEIQLQGSWLTHLRSEFEQLYMRELLDFLRSEKAAGKIIYPASKDIFNALNTTPLDQVKVVILGQDPYHGQDQAHGLSFSVPKGIKTPPSLKNIYKEINADLGLLIPSHGNLQHWAKQGVLLLNSVLTVEHSLAASHQKKGWEQFTDAIISLVNKESKNVVFLLWGSYAQKKGHVIDGQKHLILEAPHPSPLSAHRGFLGCKHFSKTNHFFKQQNKTIINWSIPE